MCRDGDIFKFNIDFDRELMPGFTIYHTISNSDNNARVYLINDCKEKAQRGDPTYLCALGYLYYFNVIKAALNFKYDARNSFEAAESKGLKEATYALACLNLADKNNREEGVQDLKRLTLDRYSKAGYTLGCCYETGEFIEANKEQALKFFLLSAEDGYGKSYKHIGNIISKYAKTDAELAKANEYYELGTKYNDPKAWNNLGNSYNYGTGVEKNIKKAIFCYENGIKYGSFMSKYSLGEIYYNGYDGETGNKAKGLALLKESAAEGNTLSRNFLNKINIKY